MASSALVPRARRSLRILTLEDRRMLAPVDLLPTAFNTSGSNLSVAFEVDEAAAPAFDIGVYASTDGVTPGTHLMTHRVTNSSDRTVGAHTVNFQGSFSDLGSDYSLLAKLDANSEVSEGSESNNNRLFAGGVFQATDGAVHVHGTNSADAVVVSQGAQFSVTLNGNTKQFTPSGVGALRVRVQGGTDSLTGDSSVSKPITAFGGAGADTLTGGNVSDALYGGAGDDFLYGLGGNDSLYGDSGYDLLSGGYGDDFLWGGTGNDSLNGGGQIDAIQDRPTITNFTGTKTGSIWTFGGTISDDGPVSGTITFGGLLEGEIVAVNPDGSFTISVQFPPGTNGLVTVTWTDGEGLTSNLGSVYVS